MNLLLGFFSLATKLVSGQAFQFLTISAIFKVASQNQILACCMKSCILQTHMEDFTWHNKFSISCSPPVFMTLGHRQISSPGYKCSFEYLGWLGSIGSPTSREVKGKRGLFSRTACQAASSVLMLPSEMGPSLYGNLSNS